MDYKDTLNLPRTDFPMKADLVAREPQRLERWQKARLYEQIQDARAKADPFVLHDGPPFANGDVHIGTALNKLLKDFVVKFHTLRGRRAPYVPGWDCHGLPIEFKVTQEMRKAGDTNTDPASIRRACEAYARKYIDLQRVQFKRLGVLGDWDNPYLTLNKEYEADELRLFADIVEKGFVYRGKKPVFWSIPARTALAEAEVEYHEDHISRSVYVKFPVVGQPGVNVLIWTTTPWTLPANLAVAFNSTFTYSLVHAQGESYILSALLVSDVAAKCGWESYDIVRSIDAHELAQLTYQHPFCHRVGKLFAGDEFVENTTGTGFVHIAPGHGTDDYKLGLRNGLPIYSPVNDDGAFAHTTDLPVDQQFPPELLGKSTLEKQGRSDANEAVLQVLRDRKALVHQEDYVHKYPYCWRSKTPVIYRAMDQWFVRIDHKSFRQSAVDAIQSVKWVPDWGVNRIRSAVESRPDWCISRQRSWGVPIPAFYDSQGNPILEPAIVRAAADLVEKHGSNVWFEKSAAELWSALKPKDWSGPEAATKSSDTLDVWIDSGSSSRAVIARRKELAGGGPATHSTQYPFQADMYLEGSDQHRGWFQSSLLLSLAGNGAPPYKTVLTHGFMVKPSKENPNKKIKVSKRDEDQKKAEAPAQAPAGKDGKVYEKPQTAESYIKDFGADVVRLWVASQDFRGDIWVDEERIKKVSESYRVIRNALRYQLSNLYDFDPQKHVVPGGQLTGLDRWILGAFARLEAEVLPAYEAYEFHVVYQKISQFAAVELSSVYHDVVKDRLYTDPANSPRRRSTQTALHRLVTGLCEMLSPILAFTADEAWEFIPGTSSLPHVHLATWQPAAQAPAEGGQGAWRRLFEIRERVLPELEKARQAKSIGKALDAKIVLTGGPAALAEAGEHRAALQELLNVSQLDVQVEPGGGDLAVTVAKAEGRKCERCWHWEEDVGRVEAHPALCGRCVEAVRQWEAGKA